MNTLAESEALYPENTMGSLFVLWKALARFICIYSISDARDILLASGTLKIKHISVIFKNKMSKNKNFKK